MIRFVDQEAIIMGTVSGIRLAMIRRQHANGALKAGLDTYSNPFRQLGGGGSALNI